MLSRLSADERRDQLIDCALDIAERSGISAVTVRAVAEQAGVSLGIVHYCFANKDELMAAMMHRAVTGHLEAFLSAAEFGPDGSGPDGSGPDGSGPDGSGPDGSGPEGSGPDGADTGADGMRRLLTSTIMAALTLTRRRPERWLVLMESVVVSLRSSTASGARPAALQQHVLAEEYGMAYLVAIGQRAGMDFRGRERAAVRLALHAIYGTMQWWLVDRDDAAAEDSLVSVIDWIVDQAVPV